MGSDRYTRRQSDESGPDGHEELGRLPPRRKAATADMADDRVGLSPIDHDARRVVEQSLVGGHSLEAGTEGGAREKGVGMQVEVGDFGGLREMET